MVIIQVVSDCQQGTHRHREILLFVANSTDAAAVNSCVIQS